MFKILSYLSILFFISTQLLADGTQPAGSGTETDPYQVETLDNLLWMSTNTISWDKYFTQNTDIDASATQNWNNGEGFSPIGIDSDDPFTGSYYGKEHLITGLHIVLPDNDCIGFFGCTDGAAISHLGLENIDVTGYQGVGGLVGWNDNSEILNCYVTGNLLGEQEVGGLVGYNHFSTITHSHTIINIIGNGNNAVGGLVGFNNDASTISNCYSVSNLSGNDDIGGIVGMNIYSTIQNCYSECTITGHDCLGGLVGDCYESSISNSYSNGNTIEGNSKVGGLVGINISCPIINCYSTSSIVGNANVGGLIGYISYPDVQNSFWDIETSGQATSEGGTGKTTAEMQNVATYTSLVTVGLDEPWDFVGNPYDDTGNEDYWNIDENFNNGYPFFANPFVGIDDEMINNNSQIAKLFGNYPNPFHPSTTISFSLTAENAKNAEIVIYNLKGQKVKTLIASPNQSSLHYATVNGGLRTRDSVTWDGTDENNKSVSSGIYFYELNVNGKTEALKECVFLK